jgi:hypothetical protein
MNELNVKIQKWMDEVKRDLISNYDKKGFRASGKYEKDLESVITDNRATLYSAKHAYWMENGRRPNKDQSKEGLKKFVGWAGSTFLKKWLEDKKLAVNPYALAYKIGTQGYTIGGGRNRVISGVINDEKIKELLTIVKDYMVGKVRSDILKPFKK